MTELRRSKVIEWALRLGFGLMYLYSGIDLIRHPKGWYWAVSALPDFMEQMITTIGRDTFLRGQGGFEILLALLLILPFLPRILSFLAAAFTTLEMLSILLLVGIDLATFRDIGLLGAAVALTVKLWPPHRSDSAPSSDGT